MECEHTGFVRGCIWCGAQFCSMCSGYTNINNEEDNSPLFMECPRCGADYYKSLDLNDPATLSAISAARQRWHTSSACIEVLRALAK